MDATPLTERQHGLPSHVRIAIGGEPEIAGVDVARVDPAARSCWRDAGGITAGQIETVRTYVVRYVPPHS